MMSKELIRERALYPPEEEMGYAIKASEDSAAVGWDYDLTYYVCPYISEGQKGKKRRGKTWK